MEKKPTAARKTPANNAGSGATADLLPPVPATIDDRDLTNVAEVFRRSGWFGDLTSAQIATLLIVGESLGLDAGQSVFDLTVTAADGETPVSVAYREKRTYQAAADRIDALRAGIKPESGNKDVPGDAATPDPAVSEQTPPPEPEKSNVVQLRPAAAGDAEPGVADPAGEQDAAEFASWRGSIISMLRETGATEPAISDRIDKFDVADRAGREIMLTECNRYYAKKVGDVRYTIVQRLAADGKKSPDQQTGFYLYADVPTDPTEWNYPTAQKAAAALDNFLKRK